jgi:PKD repeat protein
MQINYMRFFRLFSLLMLSMLLTGSMLSAQNFERDYQDGQLFIKFVDHHDPQIPVAPDHSVKLEDAVYFSDIIDSYQVQKISRPLDANNDIKLLRTFLFQFEDHLVLDNVIGILEKRPEIEYAEKVPMYYVDFVPNDSLYNLINGPLKWKWHLDKINAEQAWDITQGSADIKVAIVDNAVWADHPDLESQIVLQRDVVNNTPNSNPPGFGNAGDWSHGTHCAGLASAATDNDTGVAGIGFNTSIIGIKASHSSPIQISHSFQGVNFAINNGADVINMSFGGAGYSQSFQNLVNSGNAVGVVFIASSGNDNTSSPHYPSAYQNVISVASTDDDDSKSNFSNYGSSVDVSAPGGFASPGPSGLLSTTYDETSMGFYDSYFGTSMAGPVVAGLAGLMLSVNPDLTPEDLEAVMKATCDSIDEQNPDYLNMLGAGRINAYEAVKAVPFSPEASFETSVTTILPGQSIDFTDLSTGIPDSWSWSFEGGSPSSSSAQNPEGIIYNWAGTYKVTLTIENNYGSNSLIIEDYIVVTATPPPYLQFSVTETETCIHTTVLLQDYTLYEPFAWNWEFEPDTYDFVSGTDAGSQNPEVIFLSPGSYNVILTAENNNGISTDIFEDYFQVSGMDVPVEEDFESGTQGPFEFFTNEKSFLRVTKRASYESIYGLHFTGGATPAGWSGTPTGTTPEQAWDQNTDFQAIAHVCNVDASEFAGVHLYFDHRQTYSLGTHSSWFRVLVNDTIPVPDVFGNINFNPTTNEDPFVRRHFDLSGFAGTVFSLSLQSCCRLYDYFIEEGDNVFVDNLEILGSMVGVDEFVKIPVAGVAIYPNPANDVLHVDIPADHAENISISLLSLIGQKIYEKQYPVNNGNNTLMVDISDFSPGLYLLVIKNKEINETRKVIIQ